MKHKVPNVNFRVRELGEWVLKQVMIILRVKEL